HGRVSAERLCSSHQDRPLVSPLISYRPVSWLKRHTFRPTSVAVRVVGVAFNISSGSAGPSSVMPGAQNGRATAYAPQPSHSSAQPAVPFLQRNVGASPSQNGLCLRVG